MTEVTLGVTFREYWLPDPPLRSLPTSPRGRYHFTTVEIKRALGVSLVAVRAALRRLKRRGEIADPYRGFHVIVPPEYRRLGCLPAEQWLCLKKGVPQYLDGFLKTRAKSNSRFLKTRAASNQLCAPRS